MKNGRPVAAMVVAMIALFVLCGITWAETKCTTNATSSALTFAPGVGASIIKSIFATTDKAGGEVKLYARTGKKYALARSMAAGTTAVGISGNESITNGESVVVAFSNGNAYYSAVTSAEANTNLTLATGLTQAGTTADYVYEVSLQWQHEVGGPGTGAGTNDYLEVTGDIMVTPGDSPVYAVLDSTARGQLAVTVQK
jgi:hypothetical protein